MKTNWNITYEQNNSSYVKRVETIYNENNKPTRYKGTIESMLYVFFSKTSKKRYTWKREVFKCLLIHLYHQKCYALLRDYGHVQVLHNISAFGDRLVRDVAHWENNALQVHEQLSSLIQHCFAVYKTPKFLEHAFYGTNKIYMLWYVQLGSGKPVKSLSQNPIRLTHKMAHEFRNAPAFLGVPEALRYAQALGFGASPETAKTIAFSRLALIRGDEEPFWESVVQFFAKENTLHTNVLDRVADYLAYKYRENRAFSMKNRTLKALCDHSDEWHLEVHKTYSGKQLSWAPSGIEPLYVEAGTNATKVVYKTVELLNTVALYEEGSEMQHCVSEYDEDCKAKQCAIFSLRKEVVGQPVEHLATLEINVPNYHIVQAKAKYNQDLDAKSVELINHWIAHSKVRRKNDMAYNVPYDQHAHVRAIERRTMTEGYSSSVCEIVRVLFLILYVVIRVLLALLYT